MSGVGEATGRSRSHLPIWVRVPGTIVIVLVGVLASTMALGAADVGRDGDHGSRGDHGTGDEMEFNGESGSGGDHGSGYQIEINDDGSGGGHGSGGGRDSDGGHGP